MDYLAWRRGMENEPKISGFTRETRHVDIFDKNMAVLKKL